MKKILLMSQDPWLTFRQQKSGNGITDDGDFCFFINDTDCQPDYVVVKGKGLSEPLDAPVPKQRTILLTGEPYSVLEYPRGYCSQFGTVCACCPQVKANARDTRIIHTPAMLSWFVGAEMDGSGAYKFNLDYHALLNARPEKTKFMSVVTSQKAFSQGHLDRLRFIEKLLERYGDRIDIYGHGFRPFTDKWQTVAPYRYHLVIENCCTADYWTEKLADPYLALTYPLYHGCTNIADYFATDAYTAIDIRDFDKTFAEIDRLAACDEAFYASRRDALLTARQQVMGPYNFFNYVADICRQTEDDGTPGTTRILPASQFFSLHNLYLYTIGRNYYKFINRIGL